MAKSKNTVQDVAKYILNWLASKGEDNITSWKLQKLVYYCQAWSLVWDEVPLFPEKIQAWADGPVCPDLYHKHKRKFRLGPDDIKGNTEKLSPIQRETINAVLDYYGDKTGRYLSDLTHLERPWIEARASLSPGERGNVVIEHNNMVDYYGGLINNAEQQREERN